MGTAEVLLRVLDEPIPFEARERLSRYLINSVRHVVPGKHVVVAGVKTGLLMRRALQLGGITDRAGRDRLDALAHALPLEGRLSPDAVEVSGARNDDGVLALTVRADGVSPAELFNAVLRHGNDEIRRLVVALDEVIPAARSTLLTGGWAGMKSVQRARSDVLARRHRFAPGPGHRLRSGTVRRPAASAPRTSQRPPELPARQQRQEHPMNEMTTLERRGMAAICTPSGRMLIVAADQRNGMKAVMTDAPDGPASVTVDQLADAKSDLVRHLGNHAPAILLDPEVALPRVVDDCDPRAQHRPRRRHGCFGVRDGRRAPLHPVRRRRDRSSACGSSAATPRRCSSTSAPTGRARTPGWATRSATWSSPARKKASS